MSYELPKTLTVCNIPISVVVGEIEDAGGGDITQVGEYDGIAQEIRVDPRLKDESRAQTLWHELIHAALDGLGYYKLNMDEKLVQGLAVALMGAVGPIKG